MKKYIKPTIKTRQVAMETCILAASFSAKEGGSWEEDVTETPASITESGKILGKKDLFESWDEE